MGKENVQDYPLPPKVEKINKELRVVFNDVEIAKSKDVIRILQKGLLPSYYISFYPAKMDACYVENEKVNSKIGAFTGEWSTSDVEIPERLKR